MVFCDFNVNNITQIIATINVCQASLE